MQYDTDAIRAGLSTYAVINRYQLDVRRGGRDEVESSWCPARADHSRGRAFVLNTSTGLWRCFPCNTSGDLVQLVLELERKDFVAALPVLAEIAGVQPGVGPDPAERARRAREREAAEVKRQAAKVDQRAAAIVKATKHWEGLQRHNTRGRAYLVGRGLEAMTSERMGVVKYDWNADPSQVLWTADGQVVNVVRRRLDPNADCKVLGLKDCPTAGTFVHALCELGPAAPSAIVVEGWADSLTAAIAFPSRCRVLGAHGASNLEKVARAAAPKVRELGGQLYLVPHNDTAGHDAIRAALEVAKAAGLEWRRTVHVLDLEEHKDLNDAWRADWRWVLRRCAA